MSKAGTMMLEGLREALVCARVSQAQNLLNAVHRHCVIGKVRAKFRPTKPQTFILKHPGQWPFGDTEWKQTYMDKCGCKVGTACGNVACPHRLVATC